MNATQKTSLYYIYWIGFYTLLRKDVTRFLRIWRQSFVPPIITSTLYFAIFGYTIGDRVGNMDGILYIQFIAPGLIIMNIMLQSYNHVVSSVFGDRFQRPIEELLVSPLPNLLILAGYISGGILRGLLTSSLVAGVAYLFTGFSIPHLGIMLLTAILTAALFSTLGFINALYAQSFDDITIIPSFVLTPLIYLGGVFYSITILPPFWQKIALFNPLLYIINLFRYSFIDSINVSFTFAFLFIFGFLLFFFLLCYYLLAKGYGLKQ